MENRVDGFGSLPKPRYKILIGLSTAAINWLVACK